MAHHGKSAIHSDGITVNISRLEREIKDDIAMYQKYRSEDEMKKRAIHSSKNYDEFRNFVSVSQLKPTSGRDVSTIFTALGSYGKSSSNSNRWNKSFTLHNDTEGIEETIQRGKHRYDPKFDMEADSRSIATATRMLLNKKVNHSHRSSRDFDNFFNNWKKVCKDASQTISFLTRTELSNDLSRMKFVLLPYETCNKYFLAEIDSEILGDIIEALNLLLQVYVSNSNSKSVDELNNNNSISENEVFSNNVRDSSTFRDSCDNIVSTGSNIVDFVKDWLDSLSCCSRFDLSVSFLTSEQRNKLKQLSIFVGSN